MARQGHEHAHLYLWTSSRLLVDGLDVMEAWGFTYHASFVVVYEDERQGTPWGDAHRLLLAGARGGRRYGQCHSRSWLHHPRPGDNFVPPEIIEMIEAVSPGPYVLLSAAQESPGEEWTCFPFESAA
jgi:N6-adenosine-specific RNA methylase IME4